MTSIRALADCIGLPKSFSVLSNFLGFFRGTLPPDPSGTRVTVSLAHQARLLKGPHFNLNVIAVGADNFTDGDRSVVDFAIFRSRQIYSQVGVGVGRVLHFQVSVAAAHGLDAPTTEGQLEDISNLKVVNNDALDISVPDAMNVSSNGGVTLGLSPEPGPCVEKDQKGMNGSVVGLFSPDQTARTFSHELGHNFGLGHQNDHHNNLMCQSIFANSIRNSVNLTADQGDTIKGHCLMKKACSGKVNKK
ncbi:MAG TPA: M12 family metallo-peptidase [Chthoniobacterales bacterium]|jgi:hypothetical protein